MAQYKSWIVIPSPSTVKGSPIHLPRYLYLDMKKHVMRRVTRRVTDSLGCIPVLYVLRLAAGVRQGKGMLHSLLLLLLLLPLSESESLRSLHELLLLLHASKLEKKRKLCRQ